MTTMMSTDPFFNLFTEDLCSPSMVLLLRNNDPTKSSLPLLKRKNWRNNQCANGSHPLRSESRLFLLHCHSHLFKVTV